MWEQIRTQEECLQYPTQGPGLCPDASVGAQVQAPFVDLKQY